MQLRDRMPSESHDPSAMRNERRSTAERMGVTGIYFDVMPAEALTYGDDFFDLVYFSDILHSLVEMKNFNIRERKYVQLRLEAYGVTNSPQWGVPSTSFGSTSFGQITSAGGARTVQVAIKGYF